MKNFNLSQYILAFFFAILSFSSFGQIGIDGELEVCEGGGLEITVNNLPPGVSGFGYNIELRFGNSTTGDLFFDFGVVTGETTTFSTSHIPLIGVNGDDYRLNTSFNTTDGTVLFASSGTVPIEIFENPTGSIAISANNICEDGMVDIIFTPSYVTAGGTYDFTYDLDGTPYTETGVALSSGTATVTLTEGVDFIDDVTTINLTSLTDNYGGDFSCTSTGTIATTAGPNVNTVTGGTVAAAHTICSGDDPIAFTETTASTGDGTLTYQWMNSTCLLYTSPSPRDGLLSRMPSSA